MADELDLDPRDRALVERILERHVPELEVWVFGSRVQGRATRFSDLDLAIVTPSPLPLPVYVGLKADLSESALPIRVDVVDLAMADRAFRKLIEEQHVVLKRAAPAR